MSKGPVFDGYRLLEESNHSITQSLYLVWSVDPDLVGDATGTLFAYTNTDIVTLDNSKVLLGTYEDSGKAYTGYTPITLRLSNGYVLGFRPIITNFAQS